MQKLITNPIPRYIKQMALINSNFELKKVIKEMSEKNENKNIQSKNSQR